MTEDRMSPGGDRRVQGDSYSKVTRGWVRGSHSGIHSQLQPLGRGRKWSIRGRGRCRCKLLEAREGRFVKNFKMISVEGSGT